MTAPKTNDRHDQVQVETTDSLATLTSAPDETATDPSRARRVAPAAIAAAVMAVMGVIGLSRGSAMGNDESVTHWAALLGLHQLRHLLSNIDAVHGFYYLIIHAWAAVGTSPTAMRIPSVIAMTVAAALLAVLAQRLTGSAAAGLFAGLIMALTPAISFYAQTARSYAFVFVCVVSATSVLTTSVRVELDHAADAGRARRHWLMYGLLVTVTGYLNELALLFLAAHACTVLASRPGRRCVRRWALSAVGGTMLIAPLIILSDSQTSALSYLHPPGQKDVRLLVHDYFGASSISVLIIAGCAIAGLVPAATGRGRVGLSVPKVALPLILVPAGLLLVESMLGKPLFADRYVLFGEAGVALLAGTGLSDLGQELLVSRRRFTKWIPGLVVCATFLLVQLGPQHFVRTPGSRQFNFGSPSFYVGRHAQKGDAVLFFGSFFRTVRLAYPAQFRSVNDIAVAVPPLGTGTFAGRDAAPAVVTQRMLRRTRIWVIGRMPSRTTTSPAVRLEGALLRRQFTPIDQRHYRGVLLTLWSKH